VVGKALTLVDIAPKRSGRRQRRDHGEGTAATRRR
jgi:hypothetical protein